MEDKGLGLYLHIPFCKQKCAYCDFCSHPPRDASEISRYMNALMLNVRDFSAAAEDYTVDTVYIGGGTPSLMSQKQLKELAASIFDSYSVAKDAEFTIEANPGTVDKAFLKTAKKCGINRISFGLQSAVGKELSKLGRIHTADEFIKSFDLARSVGFDNISLDIMYGIPYQTRDSFKRTLDFALEKSPEHISVYGLTVEDGTAFGRERDSLPLPDEETEFTMYTDAHKMLTENGYTHYEVSNFAKKGRESRHNLRYWQDRYYLGFGTAAHSYFNNQRYAYTGNIDSFIAEMEVPTDISSIITECTDIDIFTKENEYIMLRLRLFGGLDLIDYKDTFGKDFLLHYGDKISKYEKGGFMEVSYGKVSFTLKGMYVSNYILSELLNF